MLVRVQKALGEARRASSGLGVLEAQSVERGGNGLRSPDVHLHACLALQELQDFCFLGPHVAHVTFALGAVKVDALKGDVHQHRQHLCLELEHRLHLVVAHERLEVMPQLQGERGVLLSVIAHVHGRQLPQLLLGVHAKVGCRLFEALLRLDFLEVVKAQAVEAVGKAVLVQHRRCQHGVVDRAVYFEAGGPEPSEVVGGVVHDLVRRRRENVSHPTLNNAAIKITATTMSHGIITGPTIHSDSIAHNETIVAWPTRPQRFHVGVAGFEVNCNLLGFAQIGECLWGQPLGNPREHGHGLGIAPHSRKPFCSFFGSTMCSACLARVMPTYSRRLMSSEFFS